MRLSKRIQAVTPSATMALSSRAKELAMQGRDVINLSIGEPDFNTPDFIGQAAVDAIKKSKTDSYTPAGGLLELKEKIVDKINSEHKTHFSNQNIAVTTGAKYALYVLAQVLLNPEDEVLIPLPYWVSYGEQVKLAEAKPIFVKPKKGLKVTPADLQKYTYHKTKMLIINSPNNPSGQVYSRSELEAIGKWAAERQITIIADDIYGKLVYNQTKFTSLLDLDEAIRQNVILVDGLSKTYAMTGWRVGYIAGSSEMIKAVNSLLSHSTSNLSAVSQYAALAALTGDQACVEEMRSEYEQRLNILVPLLDNVTGFKLSEKPQGAFYLFPDISEALKLTGYKTANEFALALLEQEGVATVPGEAFGYPNHLRISYAADVNRVKEAFERINNFIKQ
ncbi:pyridoxal phosphate-dependent aminotransferase [Lactobacillus jensenii]|uniref:Aminotransferase n=1 Tax=Lactobacillus jensenii TaxID=109790 RepID=A0ABU9FL70_LACJE|nr:pyridoxal phosphate-dependent aminotransferase [Lactobacillus jensenii]MDT9545371.1 pyridoxal phosphate-dependent aminotransferase [Lactobacillus jensenii]